MAVVYIGEYENIQQVSMGRMQIVKAPAVAEQTVAITAGSVQSAAFNVRAKAIRVHCDAICSIAIGVNPVASATTGRMAANQTEYFLSLIHISEPTRLLSISY